MNAPIESAVNGDTGACLQTLTYAQAAQQALEQAMAATSAWSRWARTWAAAVCSASTAGCSSVSAPAA
jgi:hypothetical protein